jgi:hypothetical protein
MNMRKAFLTLLVLTPVMMMVLAALPTEVAADPLQRDGTIYYGSHERIYIGMYSEGYTGKVKVTTNATVDVYILTDDYVFSYPDSFSTVKAVEKTKNADFSFKASGGESYYLVIDNLDNSKTTDAIPTGDVTFDATYPNILDQVEEDVQWIAMGCLLTIVAVVIIVVVIIVVIIYLITRKKSPPPQQAYPQYQQQYQPPPPSPYEPPPPSPYEPPPPQQHPGQQPPMQQQPGQPPYY